MVDTIDVSKAIILTRQKQIQPFLVPGGKQRPCGFRFVRVDGAKLTAADERQITPLECFLVNGGDEPDEIKRQRVRRPELVGSVCGESGSCRRRAWGKKAVHAAHPQT